MAGLFLSYQEGFFEYPSADSGETFRMCILKNPFAPHEPNNTNH